VVAGLEEDRRQRCTWRRSQQLRQRGAISDRPEERSVVPVDGSVGNAVAGLGCGHRAQRSGGGLGGSCEGMLQCTTMVG
jgi:hypothetical protein